MKKLASLFFTMLKIGLFTFGGGYAMISILQNEFVEKKKWITKDDFINMIGIAESTPGPIAIDSATYIGYKVCKFKGSLLATIGVCIPSFVIIFIISLFFEKFLEISYVNKAFQGIRVCVVYLIVSAGIKMLKQMDKSKKNIIFFIIVFTLLSVLTLFDVSFSSVYYILIFGTINVILYVLSKMKKVK